MLRTSSGSVLRRLASPATLLRYSSSAPSEKGVLTESTHVQQSKPRVQTRIEAVELPSSQNPSFVRASEQIIVPGEFSSRSNSDHARPRTTPGRDGGARGLNVAPRKSLLGSRLLASRKKDGALDDPEANQIATAALALPGQADVPRMASLDGVSLKSRDASRTRNDANAPPRAARLSQFNRSDSTTPSSSPRVRFNANSPDSPRSATAQTQGRSSNGPRSAAGGRPAAGPRKPTNRKNTKGGRDSRPSGIPSSSTELLKMPPRYTAFPKLDLASLIKKELALGSLKLVDRTPPASSSASSTPTSTAQTAQSSGAEGQARRLAIRQELQGDYSRFYFDEAMQGEKRAAQVVNLRKILNGNSSVSLSEREFLVGKVAEAMNVGK